ncbi:site-specific integrase [Sporosarcina sp. E16_8]|uniref:tyrosine-type recombinase/integrase n=1 Tax=Sporosarcina sp. E16_8 TaxID=2789295 RepID=UPI001A917749|nr:site-specific integrase [Sporosarcina sp. E16_8]MBO0586156.1 site-specific integrase [Sporosarcina sp. E16_8]
MKNPNGYGSVFKLSGKRRRPFAVRITVGWDDNGKQLYEYLDYFVTRPEAMIALAEYNRDPYDLSDKKITYAELYKRFTLENFYKVENGVKVLKASESKVYTYQMAFGLSKALHSLKFVDIKKSHMQAVIDNCDKAYETKKKVKSLFNHLYKLAMENDLVDKDYAAFVDLGENDTVSSREPFTTEEVASLWENIDKSDFIDTILIMIYTGLRPGELATIENENINIDERYMRGGLKTAAGKNRVIPINMKILPLIEKRINSNQKYLLADLKGGSAKQRYDDFSRRYWKPVMEHLNMKHLPHDCRHTFATLMDNAEANNTSIKRIMGHASKGVTEKVYTHKDIEQLIKAIDLI